MMFTHSINFTVPTPLQPFCPYGAANYILHPHHLQSPQQCRSQHYYGEMTRVLADNDNRYVLHSFRADLPQRIQAFDPLVLDSHTPNDNQNRDFIFQQLLNQTSMEYKYYDLNSHHNPINVREDRCPMTFLMHPNNLKIFQNKPMIPKQKINKLSPIHYELTNSKAFVSRIVLSTLTPTDTIYAFMNDIIGFLTTFDNDNKDFFNIQLFMKLTPPPNMIRIYISTKDNT